MTQHHDFGNQLTVIIPAYNEEGSIAATIESLKTQTVSPRSILVVDDCSTDKTGEIARNHGATVIRPAKNTGSKAGAQNYALGFVTTAFTMALDADTTLAPDAIEKLSRAFQDSAVRAACGSVVPRFIRTLWERGRYIEYLFAFTFYKPIQNYFQKPLISSGCFSMYRTEALRTNKGWSNRTMAEDMDLTWSFYKRGYKVAFIPEAICYPIEPATYAFVRKQLRRWSHGFVQNVLLHWRDIVHIPFLRYAVAVSTWDAVVASFVYLLLLPILMLVFREPLFLLGYIIDAPIVLIPVMVQGLRRKEASRVLLSFPSFFILRLVNGLFVLEAFWSEIVMGRRLGTYEKGH